MELPEAKVLLKDLRTIRNVERAKFESGDIPIAVRGNCFPQASWAHAWQDRHGRPFPQTIAHRGFSAEYPENSMASFKAALRVGAHALETDIHLSRDNVVVLSHDADLKRCFGINERIRNCDWDYLKTLRSLKQPAEPLASLRELLEYLTRAGNEGKWVLLDIKTDNDAATVMRLIAQTIASVNPGETPWQTRIILGCWTPKFVAQSLLYLPDFPLSHIGLSTVYATKFFAVPNCSFNMLQKTLIGPMGRRFMKKVKAANRNLFAWTVNSTRVMKWCVQHEIDGVITDNPQLFREICHSWRDDEPLVHGTWFQWFYSLWLYVILGCVSGLMSLRHPEVTYEYLTAGTSTSGKQERRSETSPSAI